MKPFIIYPFYLTYLIRWWLVSSFNLIDLITGVVVRSPSCFCTTTDTKNILQALL